jgi:2-hydroxychromene-2-carboxylate isomerase
MRHVRLFFDFISPYSWLALAGAHAFAARHDIAWQPRPVVLSKLLDATGRIGPAETAVQRRYTMRDVARCAALAGRRAVGPPVHPFRSLEALRTVCLFEDDPRALDLAVALADAAWGEGRDLTTTTTIAEVVSTVGLDATDLAARISAPAVKDRLRDRTAEAIRLGAFGVPTFEYGGELFWGQDRMDHLALRLAGELPDTESVARSLLERPALHRPIAPLARDPR